MNAKSYVAPSHPCRFCGRLAPTHSHLDVSGAQIPACSKCFSKPIGVCTGCGQIGALYGTRQRVPLVCGFCWNAHTGACTTCGTQTRLIPTGEGPPSVCEACYRPRARRCGSCLKTGGRIKVVARDGDPDLCENCWLGPRTTCVVCGRERRCPTGQKPGTPACAACVPRRPHPCRACGRTDMPFAVRNGSVICWPCHRAEHDTPARTPAPGFRSRPERVAGDLKRPAGWKRDYGCHDCRAQHPRYTYGRCDRCALAAVFDHLTPSPEARRVLAPLRDALLTGPRPASSLSWLRKNPGLLIAMGTGTIPVDHAALDALPRSRTTETIRGQLVATGCLPTRNTYAADFQCWLTDHLATAVAADHRLVLHEYGTWRLLPRIHRPRDSRPQTYSTLQYAKTRIRAAQSFLTWLAGHDTPLARATQADVDDFLTGNPQHVGALEPFLRWTTRTGKTSKLACRKPRSDQPKPALTAEQRWHLLRRVLHDDALEPADRLMGALILAYAAPLTKILLLRTDDLRATHSGPTRDVYLTLGETEIHLPPVLDQLAIQQLKRGRIPHSGNALATGRWLFPGMKAGQPLSHARATVRLRALGLPPGPGRARALLHLAARVEAPLLAQARRRD